MRNSFQLHLSEKTTRRLVLRGVDITDDAETLAALRAMWAEDEAAEQALLERNRYEASK